MAEGGIGNAEGGIDNDEGGIGIAEGGIRNAQLFTDVINEFAEAIKSQNYPTPQLDEFLEQYSDDKLQGVRDLISTRNLSLLLHNELNRHREQESSQPAEEIPIAISVYEFVNDKLKCWTPKGATLPSDENLLNADVDELILWSAELWFIHQLGSFEGDDDIADWIRTNGSQELFSKYFHVLDSDGPAKFTILAEKEAFDFLKGLLRVGKVGEHLTKFLNKWQNIHKITQCGLSKEMTSIYKEHSEKYHVIPPPRPGWRMYGMHFYLQNHFEDGSDRPDRMRNKHVAYEAKRIRKSLKYRQFALRGPTPEQFNPKSVTFAQLETWLKPTLDRIKDKCSTLFISFSCHGFLGHVMIEESRPNGTREVKDQLEIEMILQWIHNIVELRDVPKVVVFQTCNHVIAPIKEKAEEIWSRLETLVKDQMKNIAVYFAAEKGNKYMDCFPESYIAKISVGMYLLDCSEEPEQEKEDEGPTTRDLQTHAHMDEKEKAEKTTMLSKVGKETLYPCKSKVRFATDGDGDVADYDDEYVEVTMDYDSDDDGRGWVIDVSDDEDDDPNRIIG